MEDKRISKLEEQAEESRKNVSRLFTGIEVIKESLGNISERLGRVLDVRDDVVRLKAENENNENRISKLEERQMSLIAKVAAAATIIPVIITIILKQIS